MLSVHWPVCDKSARFQTLTRDSCANATLFIRGAQAPNAFGVAGSPAGNIFCTHGFQKTRRLPGLGKLPRPTGQRPVLPRALESRHNTW